jgi:ELWxxDGT repeat protein
MTLFRTADDEFEHYYSANDGRTGRELYGPGGRLKNINPGSASSNPRGMTRVGNKVFFSANDGSRGRELWLGAAQEVLAAQVIQALAAGNAVLAVGEGAAATLQPLVKAGLPVAVLEGRVEPEVLKSLPVDLVAAIGERQWLSTLRRALAAREGPIVPLVTEILYPAAYAHERSVCVDTTAAGGNASLLAAA